jgi:hypothetical protein
VGTAYSRPLGIAAYSRPLGIRNQRKRRVWPPEPGGRSGPLHHPEMEITNYQDVRLGSMYQRVCGQIVAALLARDPAAHTPLGDPGAVASLLAALREEGANDQVAALAARAVAHSPLDNPRAVTKLLPQLWEVLVQAYRQDGLRDVGAEDQFAALAGRAAACIPLDDPRAVADLLLFLWHVWAKNQLATLLARDPAARTTLDDPDDVARLLDGLREVGNPEDPRVGFACDIGTPPRAREQAEVLTDRLPGAGLFRLFCERRDRQQRFRFGRETDGRPARQWGWEDLD